MTQDDKCCPTEKKNTIALKIYVASCFIVLIGYCMTWFVYHGNYSYDYLQHKIFKPETPKLIRTSYGVGEDDGNMYRRNEPVSGIKSPTYILGERTGGSSIAGISLYYLFFMMPFLVAGSAILAFLQRKISVITWILSLLVFFGMIFHFGFIMSSKFELSIGLYISFVSIFVMFVSLIAPHLKKVNTIDIPV